MVINNSDFCCCCFLLSLLFVSCLEKMSFGKYRTCRECYGVKTLDHFPGGLRRYRHLICDECQEQIRNRNLANANTAGRLCRKCNMIKPLVEFQLYEKETGRRIGTCNSCLYRQRHDREQHRQGVRLPKSMASVLRRSGSASSTSADASGQRPCKRCSKPFSLSEFPMNHGYRTHICKTCQNINKKVRRKRTRLLNTSSRPLSNDRVSDDARASDIAASPPTPPLTEIESADTAPSSGGAFSSMAASFQSGPTTESIILSSASFLTSPSSPSSSSITATFQGTTGSSTSGISSSSSSSSPSSSLAFSSLPSPQSTGLGLASPLNEFIQMPNSSAMSIGSASFQCTATASGIISSSPSSSSSCGPSSGCAAGNSESSQSAYPGVPVHASLMILLLDGCSLIDSYIHLQIRCPHPLHPPWPHYLLFQLMLPGITTQLSLEVFLLRSILRFPRPPSVNAVVWACTVHCRFVQYLKAFSQRAQLGEGAGSATLCIQSFPLNPPVNPRQFLKLDPSRHSVPSASISSSAPASNSGSASPSVALALTAASVMNIDDADRHTDRVADLAMTAHFAATALTAAEDLRHFHLPFDIWLNESIRITRLQPLDSFASEISPPITQYTAVDEVHARQRGSIVMHRVDIYLNTLKSWLIQANVAVCNYRSGEYKIPMSHDQAASQQDKIQFASRVTLCPHLSNILGRGTLWVRERAEIMRGLLLALFVHKMDLQDPSIITGGWKGRTTIAQVMLENEPARSTFFQHLSSAIECTLKRDHFSSADVDTLAWFIDPTSTVLSASFDSAAPIMTTPASSTNAILPTHDTFPSIAAGTSSASRGLSSSSSVSSSMTAEFNFPITNRDVNVFSERLTQLNGMQTSSGSSMFSPLLPSSSAVSTTSSSFPSSTSFLPSPPFPFSSLLSSFGSSSITAGFQGTETGPSSPSSATSSPSFSSPPFTGSASSGNAGIQMDSSSIYGSVASGYPPLSSSSFSSGPHPRAAVFQHTATSPSFGSISFILRRRRRR